MSDREIVALDSSFLIERALLRQTGRHGNCFIVDDSATFGV